MTPPSWTPAITDEMIDRAAKSVRARLERVLEFQIPEDSPNHMDVRQREAKRQSVRSRPDPASERYGL